MIDTGASRPWFDTSTAQTPAQAAVALLRLALDSVVDPRLYGELVRFGEVVPWAHEPTTLIGRDPRRRSPAGASGGEPRRP
jgi:hypothetical protein